MSSVTVFRVPGPPAVSPADAPHRHGARSFPQPRGRGGVGLEAAPVVAARRQSPAVRACQRRPPSAAPALGPVSSVFERGKCPTLTTRLTCRQGIALPSCSAPPAVLQTGDGSCTSPVRMLRRLGTARPTGPNGPSAARPAGSDGGTCGSSAVSQSDCVQRSSLPPRVPRARA